MSKFGLKSVSDTNGTDLECSPPRPFGNHANFFTDGGVFTTPQDHFATAMRMFILYGHHLFRQLPYPVNFYSDR